MERISTIVFDLDGTLIDSAPDLRAAVNAALAQLDRPPLDLGTVTSFIGNGVEKLVERGLRATGGVTDPLLSDALGRFHQYYDTHLTTLTRPYPGVTECLQRLQGQGLTLGVCTNKPTGPARAICDQMGLSQYFEVIHGSDPETPKKPDATPLLRCINALGGAKATTIFVGDSDIDVQTARSANVAFRFFTGGYHKALPDDVPAQDRFDTWTAAIFAT